MRVITTDELNDIEGRLRLIGFQKISSGRGKYLFRDARGRQIMLAGERPGDRQLSVSISPDGKSNFVVWLIRESLEGTIGDDTTTAVDYIIANIDWIFDTNIYKDKYDEANSVPDWLLGKGKSPYDPGTF